MKLATAIICGLFGAVLFWGSWFTISEGHQGIITKFGQATYQVGPGLHFKIPIVNGVEEIETRERKSVEELTAATANQLPITSNVSINWTVDSAAVMDLFKRYGTLDQFETRILDPKLRQASKAAIAKFQASELIRDRNAAIEMIMTEMSNLMAPYPVTINSPQIENITLPGPYLNAVMEKEQSREAAAKEQYELERQKLTAQRDVQSAEAARDAQKARADGQAYATTVQANAQAEAIKVQGLAEAEAINAKQAAMANNPLIVDYERALRWNGQMPSTIMGSDQSVLWNMSK